ncbi:hypothetical protein G3I59_32255 [Amycolatopsis rubida]|uniref:Integral membrane protein n=1 Tax=Amycolatopsis rubida TaxID=112413 RepID=A0ABX0BRK9_9PSEU|nr:MULTISPECIES: hypothetical protein [Amycolatopsis]MYW90486.1 hypothetical protein [Amycolatopsis rubida]MYW95146.1 hypothetical protein [Amycolatopsis rubida]NEC55465.1 hypothetical protein [Amycolatopsis rubida]NEC60134.1 hypothetical protein [Amycolatopsis rubida]OAP25020.1 hypothetical protein A4R44_04089 [Amycolatopsis sp. M39]
MTHHNQSAAAKPVRAVTFVDGPDSVLLNPHLPPSRWRAERVRAALHPRAVIGVLGGITLTAVAVTSDLGTALVCAGVLAAGMGVIIGWERAAGMLTEHDHDAASPCRLERRRGEFFFRSRDFTGLGATDTAVRVLIAGVDELHRSPVRAWIDPAVPREMHRIVWQTLQFLDRTRAARSLADELTADPESAVGELGAAARAAVTEIEDVLNEVVLRMHGCLVLTRAWEAKLRRAELAAGTEEALTALPEHCEARRLLQAAEALTQNMFACITAARDVVDAGGFPWEQPVESWPQPGCRAAASTPAAVPMSALPRRA